MHFFSIPIRPCQSAACHNWSKQRSDQRKCCQVDASDFACFQSKFSLDLKRKYLNEKYL